jgi:hypothetical protein
MGRRPIGLLIAGSEGSNAPALAVAAERLGAADRTAMTAALLDEIVAALGGAWSEWAPLPQDWLFTDDAEALTRRLAIVLSEAAAGVPLFVIEDPRIARLTPLWRRAMALAGLEACFIAVLAEPGQALARRVSAGRSRTGAALVWLRAALDAERGGRDGPRLILADPAVAGDWRRAMARTAAAFGFAWPGWTADVETAVDEAFAAATPAPAPEPPAEVDASDDDNIGRWCDRVFAALAELAIRPDAPKALERLETVAARADRLAAQIAPLLRDEIAAVEQAHALALRQRDKRISVLRVRAYDAERALARGQAAAEPTAAREEAVVTVDAATSEAPLVEAPEPAADPRDHNFRTADLQAEVDSLRAQNLDAGALLAARDRDIEDLRRALDAERGAAEALGALEASHAEARLALERAEADAGRWRGAAHRLADEVGGKVAAALDAARRREADAQGALAAARADAHSLSVEKAGLAGRVAGLEAAIQALRTAAAEQAETSHATAQSLQAELAAAGREIEILRAETEARAARLQAWEKRGFLRRMFGLRPGRGGSA